MKTPYGITDRLIIGFDYSKNDSDNTYLVIARETKKGIEVINTMQEDMAEDLYTILMGNEEWKNG